MGKPTDHLSTFSLGGGSWLTAKIVQDAITRPGDIHRLVFTDTLYEDADAYRFGVEAALNVFGRTAKWVPAAEDFPDYRVSEDAAIETYAGNPEWRRFLGQLRDRTAEAVPELVWLVEGRDIWEIYRDEKFLGNSSRDPCSKIDKRQHLTQWCRANLDPANTVIYFGISQGEKHRYEDFDKKTGKPRGLKHRWAAHGWTAKAPLVDLEVEGNTSPIVYMKREGLVPPRLYAWASHNNCGGFCCKAGQHHWKARFEHQPERFRYDAIMEQKIRAYLGKDVSILSDRRGSTKKRPLTLFTFGARLKSGQVALPERVDGDSGCGCSTTADPNEGFYS